MLTKQEIKQYQEIFFSIYGEFISEEKALHEGSRLLILTEIIAKEMAKLQITRLEIKTKEEAHHE